MSDDETPDAPEPSDSGGQSDQGASGDAGVGDTSFEWSGSVEDFMDLGLRESDQTGIDRKSE
jgi:hypothetical protein